MPKSNDVQDLQDDRAKAIDAAPDADLHTDFDELLPPDMAEATRPYRLSKALEKLRQQVNAKAPSRNKTSDGWIGDAAHASRASDHNPWVVDAGVGIVTALDITHDPAHGCDAGRIAEALRQSRDSRIKYIISNRRIASSQAKGSAPAWAWRAYTGSNPHNKHCHISVNSTKAQFDSTGEWQLDAAFGNVEAPALGLASSEETMIEIERALDVIAEAVSDEAKAPLDARLTAMAKASKVLMARYSDAAE